MFLCIIKFPIFVHISNCVLTFISNLFESRFKGGPQLHLVNIALCLLFNLQIPSLTFFVSCDLLVKETGSFCNFPLSSFCRLYPVEQFSVFLCSWYFQKVRGFCLFYYKNKNIKNYSVHAIL